MKHIKALFRIIDPYRQSFLYFRWNFFSVVFCVVAFLWLLHHTAGAFSITYYGEDGEWLMSNRLLYLVNYLVHEMMGHNMVGNIGWRLCYNACPSVGRWWGAAMGNGVETLLPLGLCLLVLRFRGGRYLLPLLMYWLSSTLYEAGIYAADARAMHLNLTSSDMLTSHAAGEVFGDWHYILEPLGLLKYDVIIGHVLLYTGCAICVLAIFSVYYYWTNMEQYSRNDFKF